MTRDEDDRPDETDVVDALIETINEHSEELELQLGSPVSARSFSEAYLLSHNDGFELRIGEQRFQFTCIENTRKRTS